MIDAFLVFLVVSIVPIAFPVSLSPGTERVLFDAWRVAQYVTLGWAVMYVLYRLTRARWIDRAIVAVLLVGAGAAAYTPLGWDAQMEYHRVIELAMRHHGLWNGYRHGGTTWILGYPPGTSLSVAWYRALRLPSPNLAQSLLFVLWAAAFLVRHLREIDSLSKTLFFALLVTMPLMPWHLIVFYNNLFYALISAQMVLLPLFGSSFRPRELCAYALVLVWLRPQFGLAAVPIISAALSALAVSPRPRQIVRDEVLRTVFALLVAWFAAGYWQHAAAVAGEQQAHFRQQNAQAIAATQDPAVKHVEVVTDIHIAAPPARPSIVSRFSLEALRWALRVTLHLYSLTFILAGGAALIALLALRRRGLPFLIPLLLPSALILGTVPFARYVPDYQSNAWALERLQLVSAVIAAGVIAALHWQLRSVARAGR